MENEIFRVGNDTARVYRCNTAVVGSGAAAVSYTHLIGPPRLFLMPFSLSQSRISRMV